MIYNEDCLKTMDRMPDNYIDLVLTSPPYDNLRDYRGYSFKFKPIARELYRVVKDGGVVVWVVNDATINGSETGTSFKQALFFKKIGFKLHDTMIYQKNGSSCPSSSKRYSSSFEYMFILVKGKIKKFNGLRESRTTKGNRKFKKRLKDGTMIDRELVMGDTRLKSNVWNIDSGYMRSSKDKIAYKHPAIFPEQLANDHIISWSNEGDIIYDPFMGSGTVAKMAIKNNRRWVGSEISKEYCDIIRGRCDENRKR